MYEHLVEDSTLAQLGPERSTINNVRDEDFTFDLLRREEERDRKGR